VARKRDAGVASEVARRLSWRGNCLDWVIWAMARRDGDGDEGAEATWRRKEVLLERLRYAVRTRHYSRRTEKAYVGWVSRFLSFFGDRAIGDIGPADVSEFLTSLAVDGDVSASTQNQALSAILFLHRNVLGRELDWLTDVVRAKRPLRLPTVLSRAGVARLLEQMEGTPRLVASLLYGSGLRLLEALTLRTKDLNFGRRQLTVRNGKGMKDRVTMLPSGLIAPLERHLVSVREQHRLDNAGKPRVFVKVPSALVRKYPSAESELGWRWVFPAARAYVDAANHRAYRHHLHETVVQRAVRATATALGLPNRVSCHTLRHNAEFRIMPSGSCLVPRRRRISPQPVWSTRHNQSPLRKARSRSLGRKRPARACKGAALASARSFISRSAAR